MKIRNDFWQNDDTPDQVESTPDIQEENQEEENSIDLGDIEKELEELQKQVSVYYLEHPEKEFPDKIFVKSVDELEEKITEHIPKRIVEDEIVEKRVISKEVKVGESPLDFSLMNDVGMPKEYVNKVFLPEEEETKEENHDQRVKKEGRRSSDSESGQRAGTGGQPAQENFQQYFEQITLEEAEGQLGLSISKISLSEGKQKSGVTVGAQISASKTGAVVEGLKNKVIKNFGEVLEEESDNKADLENSDVTGDEQETAGTNQNTQTLFQDLLEQGNVDIETIADEDDNLMPRNKKEKTRSSDKKSGSAGLGASKIPDEGDDGYQNRLVISAQQDRAPEEDLRSDQTESYDNEEDEIENTSETGGGSGTEPGFDAAGETGIQTSSVLGDGESFANESGGQAEEAGKQTDGKDTDKPVENMESGNGVSEGNAKEAEMQAAGSETQTEKKLSKREKREQRRLRLLERKAKEAGQEEKTSGVNEKASEKADWRDDSKAEEKAEAGGDDSKGNVEEAAMLASGTNSHTDEATDGIDEAEKISGIEEASVDETGDGSVAEPDFDAAGEAETQLSSAPGAGETSEANDKASGKTNGRDGSKAEEKAGAGRDASKENAEETVKEETVKEAAKQAVGTRSQAEEETFDTEAPASTEGTEIAEGNLQSGETGAFRNGVSGEEETSETEEVSDDKIGDETGTKRDLGTAGEAETQLSSIPGAGETSTGNNVGKASEVNGNASEKTDEKDDSKSEEKAETGKDVSKKGVEEPTMQEAGTESYIEETPAGIDETEKISETEEASVEKARDGKAAETGIDAAGEAGIQPSSIPGAGESFIGENDIQAGEVSGAGSVKGAGRDDSEAEEKAGASRDASKDSTEETAEEATNQAVGTGSQAEESTAGAKGIDSAEETEAGEGNLQPGEPEVFGNGESGKEGISENGEVSDGKTGDKTGTERDLSAEGEAEIQLSSLPDAGEASAGENIGKASIKTAGRDDSKAEETAEEATMQPVETSSQVEEASAGTEVTETAKGNLQSGELDAFGNGEIGKEETSETGTISDDRIGDETGLEPSFDATDEAGIQSSSLPGSGESFAGEDGRPVGEVSGADSTKGAGRDDSKLEEKAESGRETSKESVEETAEDATMQPVETRSQVEKASAGTKKTETAKGNLQSGELDAFGNEEIGKEENSETGTRSDDRTGDETGLEPSFDATDEAGIQSSSLPDSGENFAGEHGRRADEVSGIDSAEGAGRDDSKIEEKAEAGMEASKESVDVEEIAEEATMEPVGTGSQIEDAPVGTEGTETAKGDWLSGESESFGNGESGKEETSGTGKVSDDKIGDETGKAPNFDAAGEAGIQPSSISYGGDVSAGKNAGKVNEINGKASIKTAGRDDSKVEEKAEAGRDVSKESVEETAEEARMQEVGAGSQLEEAPSGTEGTETVEGNLQSGEPEAFENGESGKVSDDKIGDETGAEPNFDAAGEAEIQLSSLPDAGEDSTGENAGKVNEVNGKASIKIAGRDDSKAEGKAKAGREVSRESVEETEEEATIQAVGTGSQVKEVSVDTEGTEAVESNLQSGGPEVFGNGESGKEETSETGKVSDDKIGDETGAEPSFDAAVEAGIQPSSLPGSGESLTGESGRQAGEVSGAGSTKGAGRDDSKAEEARMQAVGTKSQVKEAPASTEGTERDLGTAGEANVPPSSISDAGETITGENVGKANKANGKAYEKASETGSPNSAFRPVSRDEIEKEIEEKLNAKKTQEELMLEKKKKAETQAFAQMLGKMLHQGGKKAEQDESSETGEETVQAVESVIQTEKAAVGLNGSGNPEIALRPVSRDEIEKEIEEKLNAKKTQEELMLEKKKKAETQAFAQILGKMLHQGGKKTEQDEPNEAGEEVEQTADPVIQIKETAEGTDGTGTPDIALQSSSRDETGTGAEEKLNAKPAQKEPLPEQKRKTESQESGQPSGAMQHDESSIPKPEKQLSKREKKRLRDLERQKIREEELDRQAVPVEKEVLIEREVPVKKEVLVEKEILTAREVDVVKEVEMPASETTQQKDANAPKPEKQLSKREKRRLRDLERRRIREEELNRQEEPVEREIPVEREVPVEREEPIEREKTSDKETSVTKKEEIHKETDLIPTPELEKKEPFWKAWLRHIQEWMQRRHLKKEAPAPLRITEEPEVLETNHNDRTNVIEGLVEGAVRGEYIILESRSIIKSDVMATNSFLCKPKAVVFGDVYADEVIVEGTIRGNIQASGVVRIKEDGCVFGNVQAPSIVLDQKGYVAGDLIYYDK